MREPGEARGITFHSGAKGAWSQDGAEGSTAEVESRAQRPEAEPGDQQGRAGDLEAQGRSEQLGGASEGKAKGLEGACGDGTEELANIDKGGGIWRLSGTISNEGDLELAKAGDLKMGRTISKQGDLGGTSSDKRHNGLDGTSGDSRDCSHTWSDSAISSGSGMNIASGIYSGSGFVVSVCSCAGSVVGSGLESVVGVAGG